MFIVSCSIASTFMSSTLVRGQNLIAYYFVFVNSIYSTSLFQYKKYADSSPLSIFLLQIFITKTERSETFRNSIGSKQIASSYNSSLSDGMHSNVKWSIGWSQIMQWNKDHVDECPNTEPTETEQFSDALLPMAQIKPENRFIILIKYLR